MKGRCGISHSPPGADGSPRAGARTHASGTVRAPARRGGSPSCLRTRRLFAGSRSSGRMACWAPHRRMAPSCSGARSAGSPCAPRRGCRRPRHASPGLTTTASSQLERRRQWCTSSAAKHESARIPWTVRGPLAGAGPDARACGGHHRHPRRRRPTPRPLAEHVEEGGRPGRRDPRGAAPRASTDRDRVLPSYRLFARPSAGQLVGAADRTFARVHLLRPRHRIRDLLPALCRAAIPGRAAERAAGASRRLRCPRRPHLPLASRGIAAGLTLGFAHTLGEFGVVLMIGGAIPGVTKVASIALYDEVQNLDYSKAHAFAALLLIISFALILPTTYLRRRVERR